MSIMPLDAEEMLSLASDLGMNISPDELWKYPYPGWLTMTDRVSRMKGRFDVLSPEAQDCLRSMKLLAAAGIRPFTHRRLEALLQYVFGYQAFNLRTILSILAEPAFILRPAQQDPVQAEPAYLYFVVTYTDGKPPSDDFDRLFDIISELKDFEGLFYLGVSYAAMPDSLSEALNCWDRAISIKPNMHEAWYNKGVTLIKLGRHEEALLAYDIAIEFKPDYPEAWNNKGVTLGDLGRHEEALKAYDKAIEFKPDSHEAWYNKGVTLIKLGCHEEALLAYDIAIEFKPDYPEAWNNKGVTLGDLGRHEEALKAYDKAIEFKPDYPEAWNNKGVTLGDLGHDEEALLAYDKAIEFKPDYSKAWYNKGVTLIMLERYDEADVAFQKAKELALHVQENLD